jgi:hypothetical protein
VGHFHSIYLLIKLILRSVQQQDSLDWGRRVLEHQMFGRLFVYVFSLIAACAIHPTASSAQSLDVLHELHITEGGGYLTPILRNVNTPEFKAAANLVCQFYGQDCSSSISLLQAGAEYTGNIVNTGDAFISGRLVDHIGQAWRGTFDSPQGYTICNAWLNYHEMSITGMAYFATQISITDVQDGLGFKAIVPWGTKTRQWVNAVFLVRYVPQGSRYGCAANLSSPWTCNGQDCNPLNRFP